MLFEFAVFVLVTAIIVTFSTDIAELGKKAWGSPPFMNYSGLFLAALFGEHYQLLLAKLFAYIIFYAEYMVYFAQPYCRFLPKSTEILLILVLILLSIVPAICIQVGSFIIYRRGYKHRLVAVWYSWVFLAVLFIKMGTNLAVH